MKLLDFFNPLDAIHLRAYRCLQDTGKWPEGFISDDIEFEPHWQMLLQAAMANLWVATNLFMDNMKGKMDTPDTVINLDRITEIAKQFEEKKKDG